MTKKTCCFTGHRDLTDCDYDKLKKTILQEICTLVKTGIEVFIVGGANGFDSLAAKCVLELKSQFQQIKLICVLPYAKEHIDDVFACADEMIVLSERYYRGCMHVRNRYMVNHADYCIGYCTKTTGGTAYTLAFAKQQGRTIIYV